MSCIDKADKRNDEQFVQENISGSKSESRGLYAFMRGNSCIVRTALFETFSNAMQHVPSFPSPGAVLPVIKKSETASPDWESLFRATVAKIYLLRTISNVVALCDCLNQSLSAVGSAWQCITRDRLFGLLGNGSK